MCGFLLYIIGFGAVAMRLFLVGVKNFVLRQIMIMIGRILEELSVVRRETIHIGCRERDCQIGSICHIGCSTGGLLNNHTRHKS